MHTLRSKYLQESLCKQANENENLVSCKFVLFCAPGTPTDRLHSIIISSVVSVVDFVLYCFVDLSKRKF